MHSPGKWMASKLPHEAGNFSIETEETVICRTINKKASTKPLAEEEANAERIVTAVNEYDKLKADNARMLDALKDIVETYDKTRLPLSADLADSIRVFGKAAIAQAEKGIKK